MFSPQAAPRAAAAKPAASRAAAPKAVVATLAALLSPARAEASRRNGAKSRGPKTSEGKARASRNALKHGLCAERHVVVEGESAEAFAAFEAALVDDLAPQGALQTLLAGRIVRAAWRLQRADQIEAEIFAHEMYSLFDKVPDLGLALIRDRNGAGAFDVLLRYRGAAQAELFRTLRLLKALQAEAALEAAPRRSAAPMLIDAAEPELSARPNQPEPRGNAGDSDADATSTTASPAADPATPLIETAPRLDAAADPTPDARTLRQAVAPPSPPSHRLNPKAA